MKTLLRLGIGLVLWVFSSLALSSGDVLPREGIVIEGTKSGAKIVQISARPMLLSLRASAPSLEAAVKLGGSKTHRNIETTLSQIPEGGVYLKFYDKTDDVVGLVPMRQVMAFASHRFGVSKEQLSPTTRVRLWANPRIDSSVGKVEALQRIGKKDLLLGPIELRTR